MYGISQEQLSFEEYIRCNPLHLIKSRHSREESVREALSFYHSINLEDIGHKINALDFFCFAIYDKLTSLDVSEPDSYKAYRDIADLVQHIIEQYQKYGYTTEADSMVLIMVPFEIAFCFFGYIPHRTFLNMLSDINRKQGNSFGILEPLSLAIELEYVFCRNKSGGLFSDFGSRIEKALEICNEKGLVDHGLKLISFWINICNECELNHLYNEENYRQLGYEIAYKHLSRLFSTRYSDYKELLNNNYSNFFGCQYFFTSENDKWGIINRHTGEIVIPCVFTAARKPVSDMVFTMQREDGSWIFLSPQNLMIRKSNYVSTAISARNIIACLTYDSILIIEDLHRGTLTEYPHSDINSIIGFVEGGRYLGVELKITPSIIEELHISYDTTIKELDSENPVVSLVNIIDVQQNKYLFPKDTVSYSSFNNELFLIRRVTFARGDYADNSICEVINKNGDVVVSANQYDNIYPYNKYGLAKVCKKQKYGFIDVYGKVVVPIQFKSASDYSEGMVAVFDENRGWGFVNAKGQEVIPCSYEDAGDFHDGLAPVKLKNGNGIGNYRYCYIQTDGSIQEERYQFASIRINGYSYVVYNNQLMIRDSNATLRLIDRINC